MIISGFVAAIWALLTGDHTLLRRVDHFITMRDYEVSEVSGCPPTLGAKISNNQNMRLAISRDGAVQQREQISGCTRQIIKRH